MTAIKEFFQSISGDTGGGMGGLLNPATFSLVWWVYSGLVVGFIVRVILSARRRR